jgi:DNA-binding transcriptional MerR regulator
MTTATYLPVRPVRVSLERFAARSGLHPDLVRRFVALGLIEPDTDASGKLWFRPSDVHTIARIERLRVGLSLNYAAIGLVMDLLDEIEELHAQTTTTAPPIDSSTGGRA